MKNKKYFLYDEYQNCIVSIRSKNEGDIVSGCMQIMDEEGIESHEDINVILLVMDADINVSLGTISVEIIPED